jgi:predicted aldo/keto reductase-like oxidoreductase
MEGPQGLCGGNRRRFLQSAAATGAALASANSLLAAPSAAKPTSVPLVTLGKTGQKVTRLGMGSSWALTPNFVQAALFAGVRYIDTSESYENTNAEKVIGTVIDRTKMRKDVYIVTKNNSYKATRGEGALQNFESHLDKSLERLKTDYIDCYYIHGIDGSHIGILRDPGFRAAFETLKKKGKIHFAGMSCHDARLPELLETAAEVGWIDQVMFKYNFRDVNHDALQRAVDKASKANVALVAMKTQGGAAASFPETAKKFVEKGFKKEVAAIKTVWADQRMHVVVSEMTNFSDLRENIAGSREPLTAKEVSLLEQHRQATAHLYCHGCGHLCETAAKGVPVATVLRYLRYYEAYGKRQEARALYQALPPAARALAAEADLDAAEAACPYGLPVAELVRKADRHLA